MFDIRVEFDLDDKWEERDAKLKEIAGKKSDYSSAGKGLREHIFVVKLFQDAVSLKKQFSQIEGVVVTMRER